VHFASKGDRSHACHEQNQQCDGRACIAYQIDILSVIVSFEVFGKLSASKYCRDANIDGLHR
jgi:hypothetical protein